MILADTDNTPCHRTGETIQLLQHETSDFMATMSVPIWSG